MNLLAREPVTILRYGAQSFDDEGVLVPQVPTEVAAYASVQPADRTTVITDPGYSDQDRRKMYLFAEVRGVGEAGGVPPDDVEWNGGIWRVFVVHQWRPLGPIPAHWEAEVWLVQPLVP
jgi:hypothetical protein